MRRIALAVAIAAAVAAVALVLTAAIGPGPSELARAAERMRAENTSGTFALGMSEPKGDYSVTGRFRQSANSSRGRLTGNVKDERGRDVAIAMTIIGDDMWMRFPDDPQLLPRGKRWVHMVDRKSAPETLTPSQYARFLADAEDVTELPGEETINGAPTTHYRGRLDLREVADEIGGQTEERFERMFGDAHLKLPVEAWVGHDGLPRRITVSAHTATSSVDCTTDILRYGVTVDVQPPAAASVIEERDWDAYTRKLRSS